MIKIVWGALFLLAAAGTTGGLYLHFAQDRQQTIRQQLEATVEDHRAEAEDTKVALTAVTDQLAEALATAQAERAQLESQAIFWAGTGDTKAQLVAALATAQAERAQLESQTGDTKAQLVAGLATAQAERAQLESQAGDTKAQLAEALAMSQAQRAQLRMWTERANGVGEP